jgi:hypothetical protein
MQKSTTYKSEIKISSVKSSSTSSDEETKKDLE